jgi:hypothetical protein
MNYEHLLDLQILLGLPWILPLLESIDALIKFAKMWDAFVCDLWQLSRFVNMTSM